MASNVVQSVIDSMPGMYPGQAASPPSAPLPQALPPAYAGPAPGSFGYARDRAFDQAGQDFNRGNYLAAVGGALRGIGNAVPAEVEGAYQGAANLAVKPFGDAPVNAPVFNKDGSFPGLAGLAVGTAQNLMPVMHGGQEFIRGLTGAPQASPMLPEFSQQFQKTQPPAPFTAPAPVPSSGPTNGDVVAASLHAASRPVNPLTPAYSAGAPTIGNWYDHVNQMLTGHGPAAGHEILAAAKSGAPFSQIEAGIPALDANERAAHGGALQMEGARQGGPVQGAIAAQQPMSDREAFLQTLPPAYAAAIRTGHFSRDQVVHLLGQAAPQMTHERDPVWVGKNASANALSSLANLTAHGVTEDKNGNVSVAPWTLQLPADRLRALGADPDKGDVATQLAYQFNVHKRVNSIWSQFFNSIIPLMQQGQ